MIWQKGSSRKRCKGMGKSIASSLCIYMGIQALFLGMCRLFAEFACVRSLYTMLIDGLEHGFDFSILGISSPQLTSIFFQRGRYTTNQDETDTDDRVLPLFLCAIFL